MIGVVVQEPKPGEKWLWVIEEVDPYGSPTVGRQFPLSVIASYRELLGIDCPVETLEAYLYIDEYGQPDPDPVTGENVWTEAFQLLRIREQAREDAAVEAKGEGCSEAEISERAEQAAYDAVHQPINGGECALDRCRREARRKLVLSDPGRKCGVETRVTPAPVPERLPEQARSMRPAGGKSEVFDVLADEGIYLLECTKGFLHGLTNRVDDPLSFSAPQPGAQLATPEDTLAKYQEEA